ncbi:glycosyltransferase family 2 protein [Flavobacterium luteum]|uniref:Glycosyltransferase n=1 Tax=Flavobacterium luteum TaxID=2026654 RepID=A0A7J5AB54_9FLAO|nr:glycosyltransferase family 2 protein [Flavobacterium luteum]KAB1154767.1 glycosyltransferase [Flavobacterium luteum]
MAKLSIITINYNDKKGLKKTLESVVSQTYDEYEFIVIDGGSTDGSKDLILEYADKISYWVSENDNGVFHAMNKGIKVATGDFVIFMNGGDTFYSEATLSQVVPELNSQFDIYYGDNYKESGNSKRLKTYPEHLQFSFFYTSSLNHQSTFIRKSLFEEHFYYNEEYKIASDWEFFAYVICHKNVPYKYLKKTISVYDFNGISSNPKFSEVFHKEKSQSIQKYFPTFIKDYENVNELNSKRFIQFQYIKKYSFSWKVLKLILSIMLLFLPKISNEMKKE